MATRKQVQTKPYGVVVPKNGFPRNRKAICCGKECRSGESVVVIPARGAIDKSLVAHVVLHRRCLARLIEKLPLDADDYESKFRAIRAAVLDSGDPFVKVSNIKRERKG